jgi:hypothetical protein
MGNTTTVRIWTVDGGSLSERLEHGLHGFQKGDILAGDVAMFRADIALGIEDPLDEAAAEFLALAREPVELPVVFVRLE